MTHVLGHFANTWILAIAGSVNGRTKDHRTRKRLCESCAAGTETFQGTCRPCQERCEVLRCSGIIPPNKIRVQKCHRTIGTDQSMKQRQVDHFRKWVPLALTFPALWLTRFNLRSISIRQTRCSFIGMARLHDWVVLDFC